jgi:pimeloyl-ACP methyl ester carboxylesterase
MMNSSSVANSVLALGLALASCGRAGLPKTEYVGTMAAALAPGRHDAQVNGTRLSYRVAGAGPILFMTTPGWGPDTTLYEQTMNRIERTFTTVYIDSRGSGLSERKDIGDAYRFGIFADDLEALRAFLQLPKVWMMGQSMGGMIAIDYCGRYAARCAGLIVADSSPSIDDTEFAQASADAAKAVQDQPWFAPAVAAERAVAAPQPSDAALAQVLSGIWPLYFHDQSKLTKYHDDLAQGPFSAFAFNMVYTHPLPELSVSAIGLVTAPTLVIEGQNDIIVPPVTSDRFMAVQRPERLIVPKAAHFPWLEQPELFFAGLEAFVQAHP